MIGRNGFYCPKGTSKEFEESRVPCVFVGWMLDDDGCDVYAPRAVISIPGSLFLQSVDPQHVLLDEPGAPDL